MVAMNVKDDQTLENVLSSTTNHGNDEPIESSSESMPSLESVEPTAAPAIETEEAKTEEVGAAEQVVSSDDSQPSGDVIAAEGDQTETRAETPLAEEASQEEPLVEKEAQESNAQEEAAEAPLPGVLPAGLDLAGLGSFVESCSTPGEKLNAIISFMEEALAQSGSPRFKDFWEARKLCLPLFKEDIVPVERSYLWGRYSELSKEARRLKDLLDEQASFAIEQIDTAIQALEEELKSLDQNLSQAPKVEFSIESEALTQSIDFYQEHQRQLNFLNQVASRINSLRKELMKTEMRVRFKNKFFQRLSVAGDGVFPLRKQLIKEVSECFEKDVAAFVKAHFSGESFSLSLFALREEIKALQGIAKLLTLNTHSFSQTRGTLSKCWDSLREADKERKKDRAKRRQEFREQVEDVQRQITEFSEAFAKEEMSSSEANKRLDALYGLIRGQHLPREDVAKLKEALAEARKPLEAKEEQEREERRLKEEERMKAREKYKEELQGRVEDLLNTAANKTADELVDAREAFLKDIQSSDLLRGEKQALEKELKPLRELVQKKKEDALLALSKDDQEALKSLQTIFEQRNEQRNQLKAQWETLRKSKGSSGMDFAKAMEIEQSMEEKREEIERSEEAVKEIEERIASLKESL